MTDRSVVIRLKGEISDFRSKMRQAGLSARKELGGELDALAKKHDGLDRVGASAGKIGLVAAAGFAAAVGAAANFDQAMSHVAATGQDARSNIDALRQAALDAGAATAFSATESAQGIEALAKAGVSATDTLGGGLKGALDLAAAGTIDVSDAAETAATAMTQFGLSGEDVPHIADLLAAAAGKAQGEVGDMAFALKQSGLVADQVGLSIEETTGALAAFASAGLLGSDAGTSFKTMLGALTPNSAKAAKEMKSLGLSAFDAQGNFIGLEKFAGQLQTQMKDLTNEQRQAKLETIFGSDAIRAATVLYDQGADGIHEWINAVNDQGFAAETAATKMDNLKGDLEKLKGSLETALIGSGTGAQGPLREITQGLENVVNAFNKLPPAAQGATVSLAGITAVTGGSLWFGTKVIGGIVDARESLQSLSQTAPRTARALAAVGKAGALLTALSATGAIIKGIEQSSARAVPKVEKLTGALLDLGDAKAADALTDQIGELGSALKRLDDAGFDNNVLDKLNEFGSKGGSIGDAVRFVGLNMLGLGTRSSQASSQLESASNAIEGVDAALENIVLTGSPDRARQAFEDLATAQGLSGDEQKDLLALLPRYSEALDGASNQTKIAGESADGAADGMGAMGDAAGDAEGEVLDLAKAFETLSGNFLNEREAGRAVRDSFREIRQALRDYRKEHGDLRGAFKAGTESGDEFAGMLDDLATKYQAQIDTVFKLTGSEKKAREAYRESRRGLMEVATQLGMTKEQAKEYVDQVLGTPPFIKTTFDVDTASAQSKVDAFFNRNAFRQIPVGIRAPEFVPKKKSAMGGAIYGPGTGTSDSIPALLSNGEHVLTAAEVAAAGGQGAIYAWRKSLKGFASGGAVETFARRPWPMASGAGSGGGGPMRITGTLDIPGFGLAQMRGVAMDVFDERDTFAASRGRGQH